MTRRPPRLEWPLLLVSLGALLGAWWVASPWPGPEGLTAGRVVVLVALAGGAAGLASTRTLPRLSRPAWVCLACLLGADVLVLLSASTRGCFCAGAASGFFEFSAVVVVTTGAVILAPSRTAWLGCAVVCGAVVLALLALLGVGLVGPTAPSGVTPGGARLSGTLGNPNLLGMYLSLALPAIAAAAWHGGRRRWWAGAAAIPLLIALAATFSRGALLGTVAGVGVSAVLLLPPTRRARLRFAGVAAGFVVLAGLGYSSYNDRRTVADTRSVVREAAAVDRGGLDARAQGPIPSGPSRLSNPSPGVVQIRTNAPGQGVSIPLRRIGGGRYRARFDASSPDGTTAFAYALADNIEAGPSASSTGTLRPAPATYALSWLAGPRAYAPRLYVWSPAGPAVIRLTAVRVGPGLPSTVPLRAIDLRLLGPYAKAAPAALERRFVQSRVDAAKEAVRLMRKAPLRGIGWSNFAGAVRTTPGSGAALATHNEPLRFAAELGVPGLLLLAGFLGGLLLAAWRLGGRIARSALTGTTVAGIVGLCFVNALASPAVSLPLAIAAGATLGLSAPRRDATTAAPGTDDRGRPPTARA